MTRLLPALLLGLAIPLAAAAQPDLMQYGRAYLAEGEAEAAVKSYSEALRLAPLNPVVLNNLGVAKAALGDYQAATDLLVRAVRLAPQRADIKENLSNLQAWTRSYNGAGPAAVGGAAAPVPEPPPLWQTRAAEPGSPESSRPVMSNCANEPCK